MVQVERTRPCTVERYMGTNQSDLPRHQRPLWEVYAFVAALLGLIALASRTSVEKFVKSEPPEAPAATAGFTGP